MSSKRNTSTDSKCKSEEVAEKSRLQGSNTTAGNTQVAPVGPVQRVNNSFSIDSLLMRPDTTRGTFWSPEAAVSACMSDFIVPSVFADAHRPTCNVGNSRSVCSSRFQTCNECARLLQTPLTLWSVSNVTHYLLHAESSSTLLQQLDKDVFARQEIDGEALALLDRELLVRYLGFSPVPAAATMRLIDELKSKLKRLSSPSTERLAFAFSD